MAERASEETLVRAPADVVMQVLVDYERYPEWAQSVKEVEIRETDEEGRGSQVWFHVDARVMEVRYTLAYEYGDNHLSWALVEGDQLNRLEGEYLLREDEEGTRVRYTLEVDPAVPVPGFLKKRAAKQILETGLGDLKRRAESLA